MIGRIMKSNVIKKIMAGLLISCSLLSCNSEPLQGGVDTEIILDIDQDAIHFYPLGDKVVFSYFPKDLPTEWIKINGDWTKKDIFFEKESFAELTVNENDGYQQKTAQMTFVDENGNTLRTISLIQDPVTFKVTDKDYKDLEKDDYRDLQGQEYKIVVESNVNFKAYASDGADVDESGSTLTVNITSAVLLNGSDNFINFSLDLLDKDETEVLEENYFNMTLVQKAFQFRWTDDDVDKAKDHKWKFNDIKSAAPLEFQSSGDWALAVDSMDNWFDYEIKDTVGRSVEQAKGPAGKFKIEIRPKNVNEDKVNSRSAKISIAANAYKDNPLVINLIQESHPVINLIPSDLELIENGQGEQLRIEAPDLSDYVVHWSCEQNNIVEIDADGFVTPKNNGKAIVVATIKIGDGEPVVLHCEVTVVRQYDGSNNPGGKIDQEDGEW